MCSSDLPLTEPGALCTPEPPICISNPNLPPPYHPLTFMGSISQVAPSMSADLPVPETRVLAIASHVRRRALLLP